MRRPLTVLSLALAGSLLAATVPAAFASPAIPIPSDPRDALLQPFTGSASTAKPLPLQQVPQHPYMAANGGSNIHNDAYQSDTYNRPGPVGRDLQVASTLFGAECASVTFDKAGRIVTVCVGITGATLRLIDPTTLATIASYQLPPRENPLSFSFQNFSGGGYFYLDHLDRAVVSTFDGHIVTIKISGSTLTKVRDVDVSAVAQGSGIQSALPDWHNNLWFVTVSGKVGFVTPAGAVRATSLPAGETIANSFAMDESGGVFIVSTHALYRFDVRNGRPGVTWRKPYDNGSRIKPGQVSQGSGTTPTLIGAASSKGGGSIAITDNADPRMNVLVFRRGKAGPGAAPLCKQPVFAADLGSDENSLVSVPGGLIAENNYGYAGPIPKDVTLRSPDTEPGVVKVAVDYVNGGCRIAWENKTVRVPTLVSKADLATGLLYTYTHPSAAELPWLTLPLTALAPESWFFTALDLRTGKQVFSRLVGSSLGFNNNYAPVSIGPDGAAYVGTLGGLVRIADGS